MGLRRLAISNPSANTDTTFFTSDGQYLVSVIAANTSTTTSANIRVWVEPSGSSSASQYAYIVYDIPVDASNSYETFRFAINQNDVIKIRSTTANLSFQLYGLVQYDVNLGAGISTYSATAPISPVDGMIWVDSDGSGTGNAKPAYVYSSDSSSWVPLVGGIDTSANYNFTGQISLSASTSIGNVSSSEIQALDGVTSSIQTMIDSATPAGIISPFAGSSAPSGWLLCFGQNISRTTYANLFSVIGTTYGSGDGSTTFSLPDLRGRVIAALDNMGGSDAGRLDWTNSLGTSGGAQTHTLITAEMPSHTHTQDSHTHTQNAHTHIQDAHGHIISANSFAGDLQIVMGPIGGDGNKYGVNDATTDASSNTAVIYARNTTATNQNTTATNQNTTATNQNTGGNGAHNNMQPTILLNYIIKV